MISHRVTTSAKERMPKNGDRSPARGKKRLEERSSILSEKPWNDLDTMIQLGGRQDREAGTKSAAFRVVGSIDEPRNARLNNSSRTHRARFKRDIQNRIGEPVVA
jgi:hypothetical protein